MKKANEKKARTKAQVDRSIKQQCSFKPQINQSSKTMVRQHKAYDNEGMEFYHDRRLDKLGHLNA